MNKEYIEILEELIRKMKLENNENKIKSFTIPNPFFRTNVYPMRYEQPCAIAEFMKNNPGCTNVMMVCFCPRCSATYC